MFNISFITCIKMYISYKSVEDQTFYGRNGCLTPSHSVTQPPDLGFWLSRSSLVFICFGQNVTRTKIHVFWQFYNQDPKPCKFSKFPIMYLFFSYFLSIKKKKVTTPYHLPKKRGALKALQKYLSFLRGTPILAVSHSAY